MNIPVVEHERLVAVLFVNQDDVRQWTHEECEFMREIAGRTRTATERVRSETSCAATKPSCAK